MCKCGVNNCICDEGILFNFPDAPEPITIVSFNINEEGDLTIVLSNGETLTQENAIVIPEFPEIPEIPDIVERVIPLYQWSVPTNTSPLSADFNYSIDTNLFKHEVNPTLDDGTGTRINIKFEGRIDGLDVTKNEGVNSLLRVFLGEWQIADLPGGSVLYPNRETYIIVDVNIHQKDFGGITFINITGTITYHPFNSHDSLLDSNTPSQQRVFAGTIVYPTAAIPAEINFTIQRIDSDLFRRKIYVTAYKVEPYDV